MPKRKFQNEEDEEAEDQEYQDDQSPDHDPEPSSADNHEEGPSTSTDRVLRSGAPLTVTRPAQQYSEEDEEDLGGDGNDATFEDNTDAVDSKVRPQLSILDSLCLLNHLTLAIPTSLTLSVGVKA